jgi:perosamine synthetase
MCSILVPRPADRDPLRAELVKEGVETRPLFSPVHSMPMYSKRFQKYPVAESLGRRGINLPSYPSLTRDQVGEIAAVIRRGQKSRSV